MKCSIITLGFLATMAGATTTGAEPNMRAVVYALQCDTLARVETCKRDFNTYCDTNGALVTTNEDYCGNPNCQCVHFRNLSPQSDDLISIQEMYLVKARLMLSDIGNDLFKR
ncbi:hypothetical protein RRF57_006028 [Xylaria bambusicola]|uniref:Uncharacterized protein n=1 Tax=Xylaria bambusicola TaxID=326684 RepID=A0AAN7UIQ9_9PEZI